MKRAVFVSIFFVILGGVPGIVTSTSTGERMIQIPFVTVDKGLRSGIRERKLLVVKTEEEWKNLWSVHKESTRPDSPVPGIDFKKETILAVLSGEKRTGGYGIEIKKVQEDREKGRIVVSFVETRPSPDAFVTQALTQPYHIIKIQKVDLPVVFNP